MTVAEPAPPRLPTRRELFDPPPGLTAFPEISPAVFPSESSGWVVTGYELARAVFADPRFSADRAKSVPVERKMTQKQRPDPDAQRGMFLSDDPPVHTHYRRLLTGQFTVRRMRELEPRIEQIVAEHLDAMAAAGPSADLVEAFALPVPSLVICELLGVDPARRAEFQRQAKIMISLHTPQDEAMAAVRAIREFMRELIVGKRANPDDALLSGLIADTDLDDTELSNIGFLLLTAGHETTANMLALGTFALLQNPDQMALLRADPDLTDGAVEELLRYLSIVNFVAVRVATEDVDLGGAAVRAGDTVLLALPAVNRDAALTADPDRLDVTRERTHHLAFGHGVHQCLGQQLARVEMRIGFRALLERFPTLALATDPANVPLRSDMAIYGVHELPVTWSL